MGNGKLPSNRSIKNTHRGNPRYDSCRKGQLEYMHEKHNIEFILTSCRAGNRAGQKKLYELYYSYGMSVCLRYTNSMEEAQEVLNDGFYKVFKKIDQYDSSYPFKKWFRVILIHAAIDHHRKYKKLKQQLDTPDIELAYNEGLDNLAYEDVLQHVQKLPPAYRMVFNLYAIEGYMHHEIAEKLNISVGTSKSNYSKARKKLQTFIGTTPKSKSL